MLPLIPFSKQKNIPLLLHNNITTQTINNKSSEITHADMITTQLLTFSTETCLNFNDISACISECSLFSRHGTAMSTYVNSRLD